MGSKGEKKPKKIFFIYIYIYLSLSLSQVLVAGLAGSNVSDSCAMAVIGLEQRCWKLKLSHTHTPTHPLSVQ